MPRVSRRNSAEGRTASPFLLILVAAVLAVLVAPAAQGGIVGAGWGGTILASSDGTTWNQQPTGTGASSFATAAGWPSVSVGAAGMIIASDDGSSWQASPSGTPQWLNSVTRVGNTWIAVGTAGTIMRREGNGPWQETISPTGADLNAIVTDGTRWLAVGAGGTVVKSPDGVGWTVGSAGTSTLMAAAVRNGTWLVAGAGGDMLRSSDLVAWTPVDTGTSALIRGLAADGDGWFAVGNGGMILHSSDATTWSALDSGTGANLAAVAAGCQGTWAAVGDAGVIVSSDDGDAWSPVASGTTENLRGVACAPAAPAALTCPVVVTSPGVTVMLQASGGTPSYSWTSSGTPDNATGPSYSVSFAAPGNYEVTLTDSGGLPYGAQAVTCEVDVVAPDSNDGGDGDGSGAESAGDAGGESSSTPGAPLGLSCMPATQSVVIGAAAALEADGMSPFSWQAPAAATTEVPGLSSGFAVTYSALGTYTVTVTGGTGQSASCTVHVVDALHASAGGPYAAQLGPEVAFVALAASISGGAPPYSCAWTGTGLLDDRYACSTGAHFSSVGDAALVVTVTDAAGNAAAASTVVHVIPAPVSTAGPEANPSISGQIIRGQGSRPDGLGLCAGDGEDCRLDSPLASAPGPARPASSSAWPEPPAEAGLALAVIVGTLAGLFALRYFLVRQGILFAVVVLFSRLRRSDLMENPTRAFLVERIASEPGVHFRELVRVSGKGRGTVQHHLNVLVSAGFLQPVRIHGFTGYRLPEGPWTEHLPASRALKAPQAKRFMEILHEEGCLRVAELAARCGLTYGGAIYHVRRLVQAGLVELLDAPGQERQVRLAAQQTPRRPHAHAGAAQAG